MFTLEGKLTFINIDQSYLKKLHDACSEVYYKSSGYENKPYIGILLNKNDRKYVIPLSSAKEKHKSWKNVNKELERNLTAIEKCNRDCLSCTNSTSEPCDNGDILHCMEQNGKIVEENGYCDKWN